jgi:hypothetical protein
MSERQIDRKTERQKVRKTKVSKNTYTILMIPNMTLMIEKSPNMKAINRSIDRGTERKKETQTDTQKDRKTDILKKLTQC